MKKEISLIAHKQYKDTQVENKNVSDNIVNFCNTGFIGRASCAIQGGEAILGMSTTDKLNGQEYYDQQGYSNEYKWFLSILTFNPAQLRNKEVNKSESTGLMALSPEDIIKFQKYTI